MTFSTLLQESPLILTECAIAERLRRRTDIELHPLLFNTVLIYEEIGRQRLEEIYFSYLSIAQNANLPMLLCAPTWRVNQNTIEEANAPVGINRDAVAFMQNFRKRHGDDSSKVVVGALLAPKNDCYLPQQALNRQAAYEYHAWQVAELACVDTEVLIAQTMPAVGEALGMAQRLAESGKAYIISFVINRYGRVLDGTPLVQAMDEIDQNVSLRPSGYMVNCVYPTFLQAQSQSSKFFQRLIGIQANSSSKDHDQLDGSDILLQDSLSDWGKYMLELHQQYGVKILGGCCGTNDKYLQYLVDSL